MSRENLGSDFLEALNTYVHEAAHKEGPHGDTAFEYELQNMLQRIQKLITENPQEFQRLKSQWDALRDKMTSDSI